MEKEIIVKTENLSIGYFHKNGNTVVNRDINLSLRQGTLVALIGANGIGKSTLLRTVTGIQQPISGKVLLDNTDIRNYSVSDLAQKLSIVLTESLPPSNLTVFELIALGRQPYTNWLGKLTPEDILKVNEAIELTQIKHLCKKRHFEISDGQMQKVLIARALAQDTPMIVLDEPTTHLDLQHKALLFRLLKKLASETNKCLLFSTHDIDLALQMSDQIILMNPEKVIMDTPANIIASGVLDTLFPDESIVFDIGKNKFIFKNL